MLKILRTINYIINYLVSNNINENKLYKSLNNLEEIKIVDIGSNQGDFFRKINRILNHPTLVVYSVDPNQELLNKQNIQKGTLYKFPLAIGNFNGEADFYEKEISSHSSLLDINFNEELPHNETTKRKVECKTLEKFISDQNLKKIDILKIDIEGFESKIISDIINITKFCEINIIKIEIMFRNDKGEYDDQNWLQILNVLSSSKFKLIGMSNIKYKNNKLFFFDAIFQNNLFKT